MARGRSGGSISMWDPNTFKKDDIWCDKAFIIMEGRCKNSVGDCFLINIYGPQDLTTKAILWNRLSDFMHNHNGKYLLFGNMNVVRNENEMVWLFFSRFKAGHFNSFIDSIDCLWSDHNPILLHVTKSEFGLVPFKLYHSWFLHDGFEDVIKMELTKLEENSIGKKLIAQSIHGIMNEGVWISDPLQIKEAFLHFFKEKFQVHDSQMAFPPFVHSLDSSRASVLVNDSPTSEFSLKRGLRQGDHILPFLFNLVMEGLHITLSHLLYADDVVITTDWSVYDLDNIIRVLQVFYLASGLKIKIHKSNVYGIGVSNDEVSSMANNSVCASGSFPLTYLGLPIGSIMSIISNWKSLLDRFHLRLSSRKTNFLSIGVVSR
ncbi:RNA-directed DNA polymerase, eukaryota, reverse transcriptase zinc-binding domain protein [Tanacetum coccineum]